MVMGSPHFLKQLMGLSQSQNPFSYHGLNHHSYQFFVYLMLGPHLILPMLQISNSELEGVLNLPNQLVMGVIVSLDGLGPYSPLELAFGVDLGLSPSSLSQRISYRNMKTLSFVVICLQFTDVLSQMLNIYFNLFFHFVRLDYVTMRKLQ